MLSRPISRSGLAFAYWLGFATVAVLVVVPTALVIAVLQPLSIPGFAFWTLSLLLEALCVVAMALFTALALRSAVTAVMACLGFYVLSRMMAFFVMAADSFGDKEPLTFITKYALKTVATVIPRLDFFGKTEWLIYGLTTAVESQLFLLQAAIFIPLLLFAAILDFRRKEF
jgi:hypothetical protein